MYACVIGRLLDNALSFAMQGTRRDLEAIRTSPGEPSEAEQPSPKDTVRLRLIQHLRSELQSFYDEPGGDEVLVPIVTVVEATAPTYREIIRSLLTPKAPATLRQFHETDRPDLIVRDMWGKPAIAVEVGYGLDEVTAMAAIDRLLHASLATTWRSPLELVAYVFVHEVGFGEIIRNTEKAIDDWLDANYGPFNGMKRAKLPPRPRLTRSSSSARAVPSLIDPTCRSTTHVAFAITFEFSGF